MIGFLVSLLILVWYPIPQSPAGPQPRAADDYKLTIVRGRASCVDASGKTISDLFDCGSSPRFSFVDKDGHTFSFIPTDIQAPIFGDSRVRQRDLQVTARLRAKDQLEIIKVQAVRDGKLYDIYYYCELCNIRAYVPGECPCCHNQLEFREVPEEQANH